MNTNIIFYLIAKEVIRYLKKNWRKKKSFMKDEYLNKLVQPLK